MKKFTLKYPIRSYMFRSRWTETCRSEYKIF